MSTPAPTVPIRDIVRPVVTWNPKSNDNGSTFRYIDIASIDRESRRITDAKELACAVAPSRARQLVETGDIVISTVRPNLNGVAYVPAELHGATASTGFCVLRVDPQKACSRYLFHWVASPSFVADMTAKATGQSYPAVSDAIIKDSTLPLPPLPEQKRIADILDKADAIRRKRAQALELTDQFLQSVFLDMFGDPVTNPKGWETVSLGETTFLDAPMVDPRKPEYIDLPHIGPDRIERDTGRLLESKTAREDNLISGKFLFDGRYVLYSKIRPYLRKVALVDFTGLCSADVYPVRPDLKLLTREYLYSLLISEAFLKYTKTLPNRASIPKLNRDEFANFTFPLPPKVLQEEYSRTAQHLRKLNGVLGSSLEHIETLFSSLVHRAFRGELR